MAEGGHRAPVSHGVLSELMAFLVVARSIVSRRKEWQCKGPEAEGCGRGLRWGGGAKGLRQKGVGVA